MRTFARASVIMTVLFTSVGESDSAIIYQTDFAGGLPAGWSIVDGYSDSKTWTSANPGERSNANWNGTFMIIDSDWAGSVDMDEELVTQSFDFSKYANVTLKFKHYFNQWDSEICDVDVRVSGNPWQNIASYQGYDASGPVELDLSSIAAGQPDVQIRWHYYNARYEYYWGIDDVEIHGEIRSSDGVVTYHAVICGISDYPGTENDLDYGDDDVEDVRALLLGSCNWQSRNITVLVDSAATKSAIQTAIENMGSAADANDVCLFLFSGHGTTDLDEYPYDELDWYDEYLVPYDGIIYDWWSDTYDIDYDNCIRDDELGDWMADLPTNKYIVFLDACHSGEDPYPLGGFIKKNIRKVKGIGDIVPMKGDGFAADLRARMRTKDLDDNGCGVVVASCEAHEVSVALPHLENGLFTYYLAQGMAGSADTNGDGWISGEECYDYVKPRAEYFTSDPVQFDSVQHAKMYDGHSGELNFLQLPDRVQLLDDFETGDFSSVPWNHVGDGYWTIASNEKHSGSYSARAGAIANSESSTLQATLDFTNDGYISFWRNVSCEHYFDVLQFYVDGILMGVWSGDGDLEGEDWAEVGFPVFAGRRTLKWTYSKGYSDSSGWDMAWIDDIEFHVVCSDCFPLSDPNYPDWLLLGRPTCWCAPPCGSGCQCDGDADGETQGFQDYRVFTNDLQCVIDNWRKKLGDPTLDPCADIDHKPQGFQKYRVFTNDLNIVIANWKKTDSDLPGNCPRPE